MNKRGFSHIEVILGFLLFIAAVVFALTYLKIGQYDNKKISEIVYGKIENQLKEDINEYSLKLNDNIPAGQEIIAIEINVSGNSSALNFTGSKTSSFADNGVLYINRTSNGDKYDILVSPGILVRNILPAGALNDSYYTISPALARKIISKNKFIEMNKSYYEDYESLKDKLGIDNDFAVSIKVNGEEIKMDKQMKSRNVFANTKSVEYLNDDGDIMFVKIRIEVW